MLIIHLDNLHFGNIWDRPSYDLCYLSQLFSKIFPKQCILGYQNVPLAHIKLSTNTFLKQEICLKDTLAKNEHSFTQYKSPNWNEDGTIVENMAIVALLTRISRQIQENPNKPIVIHCRDGITKTGILLTAMGCIKDISIVKSISIFTQTENENGSDSGKCLNLCYTLDFSIFQVFYTVFIG